MQEIEIKYEPLFERVRMLSAFEARRGEVSGAGGAGWPEIVLTDQEKPLVFGYFAKALGELEAVLGHRLAEAVYYDSSGAVLEQARWVIDESEDRWKMGQALTQNIEEAVVAYAMRDWCGDQVDGSQRVQTTYNGVFEAMKAAAVVNANKKAKPKNIFG